MQRNHDLLPPATDRGPAVQSVQHCRIVRPPGRSRFRPTITRPHSAPTTGRLRRCHAAPALPRRPPPQSMPTCHGAHPNTQDTPRRSPTTTTSFDLRSPHRQRGRWRPLPCGRGVRGRVDRPTANPWPPAVARTRSMSSGLGSSSVICVIATPISMWSKSPRCINSCATSFTSSLVSRRDSSASTGRQSVGGIPSRVAFTQPVQERRQEPSHTPSTFHTVMPTTSRSCPPRATYAWARGRRLTRAWSRRDDVTRAWRRGCTSWCGNR